jgi:hypothetical protein
MMAWQAWSPTAKEPKPQLCLGGFIQVNVLTKVGGRGMSIDHCFVLLLLSCGEDGLDA